ncbi:MAG TPA: prepilin-type N-terminal cleavage/methylation domain-containing protein [Terriglobales bacterium]|nr:prepilin-type N-terminal cleavage/methylation domain-containing protein [Terriglobales bacterium]
MENRPTRQKGFSLLELLICLAVMMVVTVAALPTISKNMGVIRLQSSAQDVGTLAERARILAVRNNTTYSIVFFNANGVQEACIDTNYNGVCDVTEPMVVMAKSVALVTDGSGPSPNQITCGPVGTGVCPQGFTGLNYVPQVPTAFVSYNDRGLPCIGPVPTNEPIGTRCDELVGGNPTGFLYKFVYTGGNTPTYAALTITPTGLVSEWLNNGGANWGEQ